MEVHYSMDSCFKKQILNIISNTKHELYIMAFEISDDDVINEINNLLIKNLNVYIIVDKHCREYMKRLHSKCKICVKTDRLFHHKIMIIDSNIVVTGCSNLHRNSVMGNDDEYIIKIQNEEIVTFYKQLYLFYVYGTSAPTYISNVCPYIIDIWVDNKEILDNTMKYICNAKNSIIIMHFWMTYRPIMDLLIEKAKSVKVHVLLDKRSFERDNREYNGTNVGNACEYLYVNNVDLRIIDRKLFHYKVILIDDTFVILGSKNFYTESINTFHDDCVVYNNKETYDIFYNHYLQLINKYPTYCYKEWNLHIFCEKNKVNKSNLCIVGSHLLQKMQIRKSNDIDFILTTKERDRLKFPRHNKAVTKYNEVVSYHWHPVNSDDELISNSELHTILPNGFKICTLKMLRDKKVKHNREKDIHDVNSIDAYLSR